MSEIKWPEDLPNPSALTSELAAEVIRTEMDSGLKRQRQRFGTVSTAAQYSWLFTDEQFANFKDFFMVVLKGGTVWFDVDLPNGEGDATFTPTAVRFVDGRFSSSYVPHMQWRVSATLEHRQEQDFEVPDFSPVPL